MNISARSRGFARIHLLLVVLVVSIHFLGCKTEVSQDEKRSIEPSSPTTSISTGPDVDLNCVIDHLQNPPESFHYMFKDESDNPWSEEADVTPQMIDGSFKSNYMPTSNRFHGAPSEIPHQYQWAIGRMASLFASVRGTSAVVKEGTEDVNGYRAVKLSIDTARATAVERALYDGVLGPGGFEKGTVWVASQGCPVKVVLDEELHAKDGSVTGKAHYEEAMVKK